MPKFIASKGYINIQEWMASKGNQPFDFQKRTWTRYTNGYSGVVVAPTGFGKTYSVFLAVLIHYINHPNQYKKGLKLLWISPLRSLAKDLQRAMQEVIDELELGWQVSCRNGDTPANERQKQARNMPDILIVTPETLHLLFAMKNNSRFFKSLQCVAVDEWHELLGNKRGVLTELALSRLWNLRNQIRIWGITATIGNLEQAKEVLIPYSQKTITIKSKHKKKTKIESILPDDVEILPWAGHLGKNMVDKIVPLILESNTTLVFTNTRNQSELWYQLILEAAPELAGAIAIHHGSIEKNIRIWIEDNLNAGKLKAVICTSSLDLGVDFKPVDTVIQIGSSKGVARFLQRAGRSGHSPFETSKIYFLPTHLLELIEVAALKEAAKQNQVESRDPMVLCYDLLIQYLVTLAVGEGFQFDLVKSEIEMTHAFQLMREADWEWAMLFITKGGNSLQNYEEFHKVIQKENGLYKVESRRIAMIHRMNIGVIVSDAMLRVKFISGGYIGMVEEYFISKLKPGDKFILAGRILQLVHVKEVTAYVRNSKGKAMAPSWLGGRLPLTSHLSHFLRMKLSEALQPGARERELKFLQPLLLSQAEHSHIPSSDEFLVEMIDGRDGYHLFMYPFEGRLVHEVFASIIAYRISQIMPITFTIAMNDYGFELLSDQPIPISESILPELLSKKDLMKDIISSTNATEMAARKFRDIAVISGLVIQNYRGTQKSFKNLQSSAGLYFRVLEEYDGDNLLLQQAYTEVFNQQLEEVRLNDAFDRISKSKIIFKKTKLFTPLSFPIKVDSLRSSMSSEKLSKRIARMQKASSK